MVEFDADDYEIDEDGDEETLRGLDLGILSHSDRLSSITSRLAGRDRDMSRNKDKLKRYLRKTSGAGAILYSMSVYDGWRFPPFTLTEGDERYLFDLEVSMYI